LVHEADATLDAIRRLDAEIAASRDRGEALRRALLDAAFTGRLTGRRGDADTVEEMAAQAAADSAMSADHGTVDEFSTARG